MLAYTFEHHAAFLCVQFTPDEAGWPRVFSRSPERDPSRSATSARLVLPPWRSATAAEGFHHHGSSAGCGTFK